MSKGFEQLLIPGLDSEQTQRYLGVDKELLDISSSYVFSFVGYERPDVDPELKHIHTTPSMLVDMYLSLAERLSEKKRPIAPETVARFGFKIVKESMNKAGVSTLDDIVFMEKSEVSKSVTGGTRG